MKLLILPFFIVLVACAAAPKDKSNTRFKVDETTTTETSAEDSTKTDDRQIEKDFRFNP